MTQAQAADLQAKWTQHDPPPLCEHPFQELAHLAQSDEGYTACTYYCYTCGEALVQTYKVPAFSTNLPLRPTPEVRSPSSAPAIRPLRTWSPRTWLMCVLALRKTS